MKTTPKFIPKTLVSSVALALAGMVALGLSACSKKERPEMEISRAFAGCWITQDKIRAIYNVLESDDKHDFSGIKFKTTQFYVVPETKKAYRIDYNALYSENQDSRFPRDTTTNTHPMSTT